VTVGVQIFITAFFNNINNILQFSFFIKKIYIYISFFVLSKIPSLVSSLSCARIENLEVFEFSFVNAIKL
jgi:hypothetical protein